jgi:hypothetical protein
VTLHQVVVWPARGQRQYRSARLVPQPARREDLALGGEEEHRAQQQQQPRHAGEQGHERTKPGDAAEQPEADRDETADQQAAQHQQQTHTMALTPPVPLLCGAEGLGGCLLTGCQGRDHRLEITIAGGAA